MQESQLARIAKIEGALKDPDAAYLIINLNKVIASQSIDGLNIQTKEIKGGIDLKIRLKENTVIKKPLHLCFGVLEKSAIQKILIDFKIGENSSISVLAHCIFPEAEDVTHIMDARINIEENAHYTYLERHIHSIYGGVKVYPKARVNLGERARLKTDFELLKGRVGLLEIDYEAICRKEAVLEMTAKVNGRGDDIIKISESASLVGEGARGVLRTRVALRDKTKAYVYNKLIATAAYARGHVDCKEIVQDEAVADAVPVVQVNHPKAHITHEAAIGSVDSKQLQTLMSRGLSEDEATELIIQGLLG
ncbi:MAG TPA: SufBD protein [Candidatus Omnitrophica bacterium]|nr:SufBD protein [Candidatus Omnitrophota bacterium]